MDVKLTIKELQDELDLEYRVKLQELHEHRSALMVEITELIKDKGIFAEDLQRVFEISHILGININDLMGDKS